MESDKPEVFYSADFVFANANSTTATARPCFATGVVLARPRNAPLRPCQGGRKANEQDTVGVCGRVCSDRWPERARLSARRRRDYTRQTASVYSGATGHASSYAGATHLNPSREGNSR